LISLGKNTPSRISASSRFTSCDGVLKIVYILTFYIQIIYKRLCFLRLAFAVLCIFCLIACNTTKTISIETLGDTSGPDTSRFFFPTSRSSTEAYLTRPAGAGPFPLMILLHGHTFESIGGAESVVPEAEAFARDLCYAGLAVSLPGYGKTEVPPGIQKLP